MPNGGRRRISLLDGFEVAVDTRPIAASAGRRKAAALIKLVALAPGHRLHRERVLDVLWPDTDLDLARNSFHQTLRAARQTLEPRRPRRDPSSYLLLDDEILSRVASGGLALDVQDFEAAASAARLGTDASAYAAAVDLYAGDLLPDDVYEEWTHQRRDELRSLYLSILLELAELYERNGDSAQAVEMLQRLVRAEPTHEGARGRLMRLLALAGDRYEAMRQYQQLRAALERDVDVEPAPATVRFYEDLVAGRISPAQRVNIGVTSVVHAEVADDSQRLVTTSFIGRAAELRDIRALLQATRMLTLTGTGGSGKTRLALEAPRAAASAYADGSVMVELAPLADPELVISAVARALGVVEEPGRPLLDSTAAGVEHRELLLVLDNCEHVLRASADLARALLARCPRLRILATSRARLQIEGETAWRVPALGIPDPDHLPALSELASFGAIQLFVERARAPWPGFALGPANAAAVVSIRAQLAGIPLAIELAAAWARVLSAQQLADRLRDAIAALTRGDRRLPERQQTLRAALDWSYRLLGAQERAVWRRLSVFADGCTLEAAE